MHRRHPATAGRLRPSDRPLSAASASAGETEGRERHRRHAITGRPSLTSTHRRRHTSSRRYRLPPPHPPHSPSWGESGGKKTVRRYILATGSRAWTGSEKRFDSIPLDNFGSGELSDISSCVPPMRLPIPNPNPKTHPNPNPIFSPNPNPFFERKQKRRRNICQHRVIFIGYLLRDGSGFIRSP